MLRKALTLKVKGSNISIHSKPDEIKPLFKQALSLKNPFWGINNDCDEFAKLGLIFFKLQQAYIQKGKPVYVGISFEDMGIIITLEDQHARTTENTFELPYQMMLNTWDEFSESITNVFNSAVELANGIRGL